MEWDLDAIEEIPAEEEENNTEFESDFASDSALKIYMRQVGEHPLLSFEEEAKYAKQIIDGDPKARERLIEGNLRLVISIAKGY